MVAAGLKPDCAMRKLQLLRFSSVDVSFAQELALVVALDPYLITTYASICKENASNSCL